ncbi:MAG: hypothetical protein HKL80_04470, partial [Acidimicrobiales bacterium]|nr:hypothetical protein [Acidimicrobiales bacterium]
MASSTSTAAPIKWANTVCTALTSGARQVSLDTTSYLEEMAHVPSLPSAESEIINYLD